MLGLTRGLALLLGVMALAGCTATPKPSDRLALSPVSVTDLPGWAADDPSRALPALARSCAAFDRQPDDRPLGPKASDARGKGGDLTLGGRIADWRAPCAIAAGLGADPAAARHYFETEFRAFRLANRSDPVGLFTGYYEPDLKGARSRGGPYQTPLLRRPPDLPMPNSPGVDNKATRLWLTRAEIEDALSSAPSGEIARLALLWVDDPVDAFFLQIQGSGRVRLPDGKVVRVGFDGQNGHPYVPVGRLLVEREILAREAVSMQSIRAWMQANPDGGRALMRDNPSYVFFREVAQDGPLGAQGVVLTPERSLAVDRAFLPLGAPVFVDLLDPARAGPDQVLRRLVIAQDTGGAIKGPVRGDVFWGPGEAAADRAGRMRAQGSAWLLLPRAHADRLIGAGALFVP